MDYREVALRREIGEEKVPAIGLTFYVYWVAAWSGDPGDWTWEDGAPQARLQWTPIHTVADIIPWDSGAHMVEMLRAAMRGEDPAA